MKKIFLHIGVLLLIIICLDRACGALIHQLFYKQTHGDDYVSIEMITKTTAQVLILGSSRASHHYNSDTLEKYTGKTVYNGGRDNMGIHYIHATLPEVFKRYTPNCVVIDIMPNNFLLGAQNTQSYFDIQSAVLLPFAKRHPAILQSVQQYNPLEVCKAKCMATYPFNSLAGTIVQNAYTHLGHTQVKGYEPLDGSIRSKNMDKEIFTDSNLMNEIDTSSIRLLKETIELCKQKNIKVVICFSPFYFYKPARPLILEAFNTLATKLQVPIYNYTTDSNYYQHPELFYDELHLNHQGAILFSKEVATKL
jgi:hypothetical protein